MEIGKTELICAKEIGFEVTAGIITKVKFFGGCDGNTKGLESLIVGNSVGEVIERLEGIECKDRGTSCPDQLAQLLKKYITIKEKGEN